MKRHLRTLEDLYAKTSPHGSGGAAQREKQETEKKRIESIQQEKLEKIKKLSPYRQLEYHILLYIAELRKSLNELTDLERQRKLLSEKESTKDKVDRFHGETTYTKEMTVLKQKCRKCFSFLQSKQRELEVLYPRELQDLLHSKSKSKEEDAEIAAHTLKENYTELNQHIDNAKNWYKSAFGIAVVSSDALLPYPSREDTEERTGLLSSSTDPTHTTDTTERESRDVISARDDAAFQQFFIAVEQNDALMDASLDRIAEGVRRIKDNALFIHDELNHQSVLLDQVEANVEQNSQTVSSLNKKLGQALRDLEAESMCSYTICFVVLVFVLCYLLYLISV